MGYRRYRLIHHAILAGREFPLEAFALDSELDRMQDELGIQQITLLPVIDLSSDESTDSDSDSDTTVSSGAWNFGPVPNPAQIAASNDAFMRGYYSSNDSF